jgi:predicted trehalose synthase
VKNLGDERCGARLSVEELRAERDHWQTRAESSAVDALSLAADLSAAETAKRTYIDVARFHKDMAERYREALERAEPLIDAQFEGHADVAEFMEKSGKLNDALDIIRAALAPKDASPPSPDSDKETL